MNTVSEEAALFNKALDEVRESVKRVTGRTEGPISLEECALVARDLGLIDTERLEALKAKAK